MAPISPALAPRRLGRRLPSSRSPKVLGLELTTPAVLRILEVLTVVAVFVFLVVTAYAFGNARSTFASAGDRIPVAQSQDVAGDAKAKQPAATAALDIEFALSDMDAYFTSQILVGDSTNLGVTRVGAADAFAKSRANTSAGIIEAARRLDPGDDDKAVRELVGQVPEYQSHVDQALGAQARGDSVGALDQYRRATDLMQSSLLPAAQRLADANINKLNTTSTRQQNEVSTVATIVTVVVVICFVMLIASQLFLFRRTRRTLNVGLIAATVLLAGGIGMAGAGLSNASTNLQIAKTDAFDSIVTLKRARATLYELRADEARWVYDRDRAGAYEANFYAHSQELLTSKPGGKAGEAYYSVVMNVKNTPATLKTNGAYGGHLADAYRSVSFQGEKDTIEAILRNYDAFQSKDLTARQNFTRNANDNDAKKILLSTNADAPFLSADRAITNAVGINDQQFDQAIDSGGKVALLWQIVLPLVALACIVLIVLGFRPRIAEYQRS